MNIKLDSHSISSRSSIVRFVGAVLISIFCLGASAAEVSEDTVKTRFGTLRLEQTVDDYKCKANLLYNGKSILKEECGFYSIFISQEQVFSLPDQDVVIIDHANKGTAGGGFFTGIVVDQKKMPKVLKHKDFYYRGDSHDLSPKIVGNHLEMDFGFEKKLRKIVKIEGESLTITYEKPTSIKPLTAKICSWLYSDILNGCSEEVFGECRNAQENLPGFLSRGLEGMGNDPAFNSTKFNQLCKTACENRKLPDEKTFRRQICPNTKFN